jgi:hypothetical protein
MARERTGIPSPGLFIELPWVQPPQTGDSNDVRPWKTNQMCFRLTWSVKRTAVPTHVRKFKPRHYDNLPLRESQMKWPSWFKLSYGRKPTRPASLTQCPKCGKEMIRVEKTTMSGRDMRTYRCDDCREDHIVDYGIALWKAMSDANKSDE